MAKKQTTPKTSTSARAIPAANATATARAICAVVAPAQYAAVKTVFETYDAQNGTAFADGFVPWIPGWNGIDDPQPPTVCHFVRLQADLVVAGQYAAACAQAQVAGLRWYEAIVWPAELGDPANSVDSIYQAGAYDSGLPMADAFAGIAAWSLDVSGALPPRSDLP